MHDNSDAAIAAAHTIIALEPVALPIETVPQATGLARTRIFEAVAKNELTARKAGKATIVEVAELRRFIRSLPTRGRSADEAGVVTTQLNNFKSRCAGRQKGPPELTSERA